MPATMERTREANRHEKLADQREAQAEKYEDDDDMEGAEIARLEADAARRKAKELREEAGEPVGEMPPAEPSSEVAPEEIIVRGIEMPYASLGGKKPSSGSLTLTGVKAELAEGTALKKGMTVRFSGVAIVNDVRQKDTHDSTTQQVSECEQIHSARVIDLILTVPD